MRILIVAFFVTLVTVVNAFADGIPAGNDSFTVVAANVNISIPTGFFNPDSDPFFGNIMLGGGSGGGMDTIIKRKEPAFPLSVPGMDTVPIEMLQLNLVSVEPIIATYGGGLPEQWNVELMVAMTLDPSNTSNGLMNINHTSSEGGTFDSSLDVFVMLEFSPTFPSTKTRFMLFEESFSGGDYTWTHAPPTGFPVGLGFYPGGVPGFPDQLNHLFYNGGQLDMELALILEPGTSVLLVIGFAVSVLFLLRYRRINRLRR